MKALLVVDAQNEFSPAGQRPVPNHGEALARIGERVQQARRERHAIAWVQHHNKPHESRAFVPGSWGAALSPGLGPMSGNGPEHLFQKDVYGAFSGTQLDGWLQQHGVRELLIVGFYAHGCLSTAVREALIRGYEVQVDPEATGSCDMTDAMLGRMEADEVRRSALLHVVAMGATVAPGARQVNNALTAGA